MHAFSLWALAKAKPFPLFSLLLCLLLGLAGCAGQNKIEKRAEHYNEELHKKINAPIVAEEESSYLGAIPVEYSRDYTKFPIFSAKSSLTMRGTLPEISATVGEMLKISMQIAPDIEDMSGIVQTVNFEGKALALLDHIGNLFGVAWDFEPRTNTVTFTRMQLRTFAILAAPGSVQHSAQMSSSSEQGNNSSGYGYGTHSSSGLGTNSGDASTSSDTSQNLDTKYAVDVWTDIEKGIKNLLSPAGSVTLNRAAGSVTVRDTVPAMRQVAEYIDSINSSMMRQVALSVKVWSVEINQDAEVDMNVSMLFANDTWKLASGQSILANLATGSLTATIVDGDLKSSSATLKALSTLGKATQVTSGSGVVMNNQPLPVQNVKRQSYLGSVSSYTPSTGGSSTALTPSQVTYGFAMTVIPNILDRRRCVLQYNVGLSSLDKMEEAQSGDNSIQLPTVSMRSFNQRAFMNMGQTLVLAGFEQERDHTNTSGALLSFGFGKQKTKTLIVITITVQSVNASVEVSPGLEKNLLSAGFSLADFKDKTPMALTQFLPEKLCHERSSKPAQANIAHKLPSLRG
ncbi:MAG: secretin N-terminal domain-containing protein [Desulfovibrio sp.]|nr:secretin N-terminal domain-containing protein [Desulfovibrio sp.]